jgi:hypothetical protein
VVSESTPCDAEHPADSARHELGELLDAKQARATGEHTGQHRSEQRRQLPALAASRPRVWDLLELQVRQTCTEHPSDTATKSSCLSHGLPPVLPTGATQHTMAAGLGWRFDVQPENIGIRTC